MIHHRNSIPGDDSRGSAMTPGGSTEVDACSRSINHGYGEAPQTERREKATEGQEKWECRLMIATESSFIDNDSPQACTRGQSHP